MALSMTSGDALADRRFDMALQLLERGDAAAAADLLAQAEELAPDWPPLPFRRGEALMKAGLTIEAGEAFRRYLGLDPADTMGAAIKLALLGAAPAPQTLPPGYVEGLFDQYAPRFDAALVGRLGYRAPELLAQAIETVRPFTGAAGDILDLGCGTGLAGKALAHRAARLDGIDLSARMLDEARKTGMYATLAHADILEALTAQTRRYDLAVAADVLTYMGTLEPLFEHTRRILKPGGLFAFTVQKLDDGDYRLGPDHRYAHAHAYLERCAAAAGFATPAAFAAGAVLRQDAGRDVQGLVIVLQNPA